MRRSRFFFVIAAVLGLLVACASEPRELYRNAEAGPEPRDSYRNAEAGPEPRDSYRNAEAGPEPRDAYRDAEAEPEPRDSYRNAEAGPEPRDSYRNAEAGPGPRDAYRDAEAEPEPRDSYRVAEAGPEPRVAYRDAEAGLELWKTHRGSRAETEARDAPRGVSRDADAAPPERRMAVTIDDLPVAQPSWHDSAQMDRITEDLLAVLDEHGVVAAGFVNEGKLEVDSCVDPRRVALLERWLDRGHELGNHGHSHLDLHRVAPETWMADVVRGERVTRPLVGARGGRLRWFRHPFLHVGLDREVQRETGAFLARRGYTVAPVTIDNGEWRYGSAYSVAYNEGNEEFMRRLGEDYVRYMLDVVSFYEGQSEAILGREIPHVLLIHAYALNADWLGRLLSELELRGYLWIPLAEALEDPAYERPIHGFTGMGGITWLHRWAITEGLDPAIFRGEPRVPQWVRDRAR